VERTLRLDLAYDGTDFRGWAAQRDPAIRTIEGTLSAHLARILGAAPRSSVAGRTDAGVHARGQVVSFAWEEGRRPSPERLQAALNAAMAPEVVVLRARIAPPGFDARFSASAREYRYRISTAPLPDPFTARFTWHRPGALRLAAMRTAAAALVGEHDFSSFCRHPGPGRSTVRDLQRCTVDRRGTDLTITLRANAFLHQMVRAIVGTLVAAGSGRREASEVAALLASRDRAGAAPIAPAHGLTLERVVYGVRRTS
jgi:tRNA pseudouridine38-40 synthase